MTTTTELPQTTDTDSALAQYHAAMKADSGDTSTTLLEKDGAPTTVSDADKKPAEEVKTALPEDQQNASNSVVLAKDGKHTIDFSVLADTREKAQQFQDQAQQLQAKYEAAQQELDALKAAAQARANNGEAPTAADTMVAAAQAAMDAGVDITLFGDFSEEAMAAGIDKHVNNRVAAEVNAKVAAAVKTAVDEALAPLRAKEQAETADAHVSAVLAAHPDAGSIAQSVELDNWIKAQPSYLQPAMRQVQEGGTTEQVIELISNFKAATGATQKTAAPSHKQAAQTAQEAISRVTAPIPASLSDIPGGRPGDVTLNDRMASMSEIDVFNAVNSGEISQAQLDAYLNRKS